MADSLYTDNNLKGDMLSVKMLGVTPDGITDNYLTLKAAIAAASLSGSPILYFPVGTYKVVVPVAGSISVPAGLQLVGDYGTQILYTDDTHAGHRCLFVFDGDNAGLQNITVVAQISVVTAGQNGVDIFQIGPATNVSITGCHINGSRDTAFQNINGIQFVGDADGVVISENTFEQLWYGMYRSVANAHTHKNIRVIGNKFTRNFGDDVNFNAPGATLQELDITVVGNTFTDNQSDTPVGGFAVSSANCQSVTITGNTVDNYQREAIHVELSQFVCIANNTLKDVGLTDFSAIQVIAATTQLAITGNIINALNNVNATFGIAVQPGGGAPCAQVSIVGNVLSVSQFVTGIYVGSSTDLACQGNTIIGPGAVSGGIFTGGTNTGIDIGGTVRAVVSSNIVEGFGQGIGSSNTAIRIGDLAILGGNNLANCNIGLAIKANGQLIVADNLISNCVFSTKTGSTTVVPTTMSFIGNRAIGCANAIDVYAGLSTFNWLVALNYDDVSGSLAGQMSVIQGYGATSPFPANLVIGAGAAAGPQAASIAFGQNSGFQLQFGTRIASAFSPVLYIDDEGNVVFVGTNPAGGVLSMVVGKFTNFLGVAVAGPVGSEKLRVGGDTRLEGSLTLPFLVTTHPLFVNGLGTIIGGLISLTSDVVGVLPVGNGGTGHSGFTDGFINSVSSVISSLPFGVGTTINSVTGVSTTLITYVTSVDFVTPAYTTNSTTLVVGVISTAHTVANGLVTT